MQSIVHNIWLLTLNHCSHSVLNEERSQLFVWYQLGFDRNITERRCIAIFRFVAMRLQAENGYFGKDKKKKVLPSWSSCVKPDFRRGRWGLCRRLSLCISYWLGWHLQAKVNSFCPCPKAARCSLLTPHAAVLGWCQVQAVPPCSLTRFSNLTKACS